MKDLPVKRVRQILDHARKRRILVVGDLMLDHFIWGNVRRISPEAPVPVVEFESESFMPGGAANVARNLTALELPAELFGIVGRDDSARKLKQLLSAHHVDCAGMLGAKARPTSVKTRIIAHQQQVVRVDRESFDPIPDEQIHALTRSIHARLPETDAIIVGDYGKGVVSQILLDYLKSLCRTRGIWVSLDPKPVNRVDISALSLITPNRKEAFELANLPDSPRRTDPLNDTALLQVAETILEKLRPAVLLITLGDQGMLLCQRGQKPFHIPTVAQEVYDVSGAGDTVIASFTLAIIGGASPIEAATISNHAGGVVVGKFGTATLTEDELLASFER